LAFSFPSITFAISRSSPFVAISGQPSAISKRKSFLGFKLNAECYLLKAVS
jgi:hypothetical protein